METPNRVTTVPALTDDKSYANWKKLQYGSWQQLCQKKNVAPNFLTLTTGRAKETVLEMSTDDIG